MQELNANIVIGDNLSEIINSVATALSPMAHPGSHYALNHKTVGKTGVVARVGRRDTVMQNKIEFTWVTEEGFAFNWVLDLAALAKKREKYLRREFIELNNAVLRMRQEVAKPKSIFIPADPAHTLH